MEVHNPIEWRRLQTIMVSDVHKNGNKVRHIVCILFAEGSSNVQLLQDVDDGSNFQRTCLPSFLVKGESTNINASTNMFSVGFL
jgi:hypothetical protein